MRLLIACCLCLSPLMIVAPVHADTAVDEAKKMEGTWAVIEVWSQGKKVEEEEIKKRSMVVEIKNNQWTVSLATSESKREMKAVLMPDTKPMGINLTMQAPDGMERTAKGIYEWQKDGTLRICLPERGDMQDRPTTFNSDNNNVILHFKKKS